MAMKKAKLNRVLFLAALAALATACKKEPQPEPEPLYDVVIDWDWNTDVGLAPSKEQIQSELNKKNVRNVFINFNEMNVTSWAPADFHRARDTLQTRIDFAPDKVRGSGTICVNSRNGAHMPNYTEPEVSGMSIYDSIWFTAHGWNVKRLHPLRNR